MTFVLVLASELGVAGVDEVQTVTVMRATRESGDASETSESR
jgi:hypothetical protein